MLKPKTLQDTRIVNRNLPIPLTLKNGTKIGPVQIRQIVVEEPVVTPLYTGTQLRWKDDEFVEDT